jgi:hypothetical protein
MHHFLQGLITSIGLLSQTTATEYAAFNTSALIPFLPTNDTVPFTDYQSIDFWFSPKTSSKKYTPFVDTGSTGVVISAIDIPSYNASNASSYPEGWEYLSSSKKLYNGHWIPQNIYFNLDNSKHELIQARVPVLCVTTVTVCNGMTKYNSTTDEGSCPMDPDGYLPPITEFPTGIRILGVGFDRQGDGMPQGTPDKNPFLNIVSIGGKAVEEDFRPGYIITAAGISIGLTERNMEEMRYIQLPMINSTVPRNRFDWGAIPACISVDGQVCVEGTALLDTGLNNSYITVPFNVSFAVVPNTTLLADGERAKIEFGVPVVGTDEFVVGKGIETGVTPTKVSMTQSDSRVFVNTGRHVYRRWEVAFDAVGGTVGFRPVC